MSPNPSLRWDLPIYTVPDERNPVPVRCEVWPGLGARYNVVIRGEWVDHEDSDMGGGDYLHLYHLNGEPTAPNQADEGWLPRLQNLPEETA